MSREKEFSNAIQSLKNCDWVDNSRIWWPNYIFHFTDIDNAVQILKCERLFSRNKVLEKDLMKNDNASADVIGKTSDDRKEYVRFYLRPRTPTQFHNEGFKTFTQRQLEAHCPVPVFFLFDSVKMLSRENTKFTDGNLAATPNIYEDCKGYKKLPFEQIYHDHWHDHDSKITFHRHAEAIVKDECDLKDLSFVVCRSIAEKETLINLLSDFGLNNIDNYKIIVKPSAKLFFSKWFYIEKVTLTSTKFILEFNKGEFPEATYQLKIELENLDNGEVKKRELDDFSPSKSYSSPFIEERLNYTLRVFVDGKLTYIGKYSSAFEMPY